MLQTLPDQSTDSRLDTWMAHLNRQVIPPSRLLERRINQLLIGDTCTTNGLDLPEATITRTGKRNFEVWQDYIYKTKARDRATAIQSVIDHLAGGAQLVVVSRKPIYVQLELL